MVREGKVKSKRGGTGALGEHHIDESNEIGTCCPSTVQ